MNSLEALNDPSGAKLMKLASRVSMPDYVKLADPDEDVSALPSACFGDPAKRRYPLHKRASAWLSRHMFEQDRPGYQKDMALLIASRIEKAAALFDAKADPEAPIQKEAAGKIMVKVRHDDAQVFEADISDRANFHKFAQYLVDNKSCMTYGMRRSLARGMLAAGTGFEDGLPTDQRDYLEKAAGFGVTTPARVAGVVLDSVAICNRNAPELGHELMKMAAELEGVDLTPGILDKVASMVDILDRAVGLHKHYDKGMQTPEEELFHITQKMAEDITSESVKTSTGSPMIKQELLNKKAQVDEWFHNYMGEVPYKDGEEMIGVVSSLPKPDMQALEGHLAAN